MNKDNTKLDTFGALYTDGELLLKLELNHQQVQEALYNKSGKYKNLEALTSFILTTNIDSTKIINTLRENGCARQLYDTYTPPQIH